MTQEAIKKSENKQKQNCNDSLASSKRIYPKYERNWRLNKNRNEICKNDETTPKYVGNVLQETKIIERKRISKVDAKHTRLRWVKSEART